MSEFASLLSLTLSAPPLPAAATKRCPALSALVMASLRLRFGAPKYPHELLLMSAPLTTA